MPTAKILARAVRFGPTAQLVLVTIEIECEECGELIVVLPGHHVQALQQALATVVATEPEGTDSGEIEMLHTVRCAHQTPDLN